MTGAATQSGPPVARAIGRPSGMRAVTYRAPASSESSSLSEVTGRSAPTGSGRHPEQVDRRRRSGRDRRSLIGPGEAEQSRRG